MRTGLILLWLAAFPHSALASCWALVVQSSITNQSPIVVRGEIVKIIVQGPARRSMDTAYIRVEAIYKNVLDYQLKVGDLIPARMDGRQRRLSSSIDLTYQLGRRANWYLFLEKDGKFTICEHIQQCRPIDEKVPLDHVQNVIMKIGEAPQRPGMSVQQWLEKIARREEKDEEEIAHEQGVDRLP